MNGNDKYCLGVRRFLRGSIATNGMLIANIPKKKTKRHAVVLTARNFLK